MRALSAASTPVRLLPAAPRDRAADSPSCVQLGTRRREQRAGTQGFASSSAIARHQQTTQRRRKRPRASRSLWRHRGTRASPRPGGGASAALRPSGSLPPRARGAPDRRCERASRRRVRLPEPRLLPAGRPDLLASRARAVGTLQSCRRHNARWRLRLQRHPPRPRITRFRYHGKGISARNGG